MDETKETQETEKTTEEETKPVESVEQKDTEPKRTDTTVDNLPLLDRVRIATDQMRRAKREMDETLDRRERLLAEEMIQGKAMAGLVKKDEEITDKEFSKRVDRGEINPLKEDGFV